MLDTYRETYFGVTARERDTIIAALRYWQREGRHTSGVEIDIAENGREGPGARLSNDEIDALIENRINT